LPDFETLYVLVLVPVAVFDRIETDLECKLFLGIPVQVEAEGVKPLIAERVGRGDTGVGVHRHGMMVCPSEPPKR
jgi:hypothetical protein